MEQFMAKAPTARDAEAARQIRLHEDRLANEKAERRKDVKPEDVERFHRARTGKRNIPEEEQ